MPLSRPKSTHQNAALALADGTVFLGNSIGAHGLIAGEVCFNTSMTGYQEILSDPSYAGQIITFTFPHIGNVGANYNDIESTLPAARGLIIRADITSPSNWRSNEHLDQWLKTHKIVGIAGVDTRRLTRHLRNRTTQSGSIHSILQGQIDPKQAIQTAKEWPDLKGMDLAKDVSCKDSLSWEQAEWDFGIGSGSFSPSSNKKYKVVALDFGTKLNILRSLSSRNCEVIVLPATSNFKDISAHKPNGVFLSNGPGDPAATISYTRPTIESLIKQGKPLFGICLGHQLLSLALGAKTKKMPFGHRGANHPVKNLQNGKVEITSQNHGFEVISNSLPKGVKATHISLFDGTLEGLKVEGKPVFSVQYHPESSPGPQDSAYLFDQFIELMESNS